MAGQMIQRGDSWLLRVFVGRDENGKRRYVSKTVKGGKKEVEKVLRDFLRENDQGTLAKAPANLTLGAYLDQWLETAARPKLRPKTFADYQALLARYVRPKFGAKKLTALTALDVQRLYNEMHAAGLSSRTIRYTHAVLRAALNKAVKARLLAHNPVTVVDLPRQERKEMQVLTLDQIEEFRAVAEDADPDGAALYEFLVATGTRPSEALAVQWADLDLAAGTVTIQRSVTWLKGGQWSFQEPKTTKSRRLIPLPPGLVATLAEHRRRQTERRLKTGSTWQGRDLVFCTRTGGPLEARNVVRQFKRILRAAGLPESVRLYDLRHTTATLMLAGGLSPKIAAERLGHSTVTLTMDTYSHVLPHMQKEATAILEALLYRRPASES